MIADLAQRAQATERVIDRFREKPFDWAGANCIRLARAQGAALGHRLPPVPMFRSALGARRVLAKMGADSVTDLLDRYFRRLEAPAFMLVGDLCVLPSATEDGGLEAVCVADGMGNLFGWHDADPTRLSVIKQAVADAAAAWRL